MQLLPTRAATLALLATLLAQSALSGQGPRIGAAPQRAADVRAAAVAFAPVPGERELSGRLIVRPVQVRAAVAAGLSTPSARARRAEAGRALAPLERVRYVPATDEYVVRVPAGSSEAEVATALLATGLFEYVEPDWRLYPLGSPQRQSTGPAAATDATPAARCPDDPLMPAQWHHGAGRLDSCAAWALETGDPSVVVGVCDTGLRLTHEEFALHRREAYNAVDMLWESEGGDVSPVYYHGTRTTGAVAANGDNGAGISGVGWDLGHRMLRVSNLSDGSAYLSDIQHGARTSAEAGDRVVNVSYHGAYLSSNPATASYVKSLGSLLLWAAGNTSADYSHADRDDDDLIVVGATDAADALAYFSSYGSFVDLVAPGVGILTADSGSDQDYATADGTSYACPLTAGVCALLWSQRPTLSPTDVEGILKASVVDLGTPGIDDTFGYGRIDLHAALTTSGRAVPTAALGAVPASGRSPLTVGFTDLSAGVPTSWAWDFGDGATSSLQDPSHTYTAAGSYTVALTVANDLGTDQVVLVDHVVVDLLPPVAEFSATPTSGVSPLDVQLTDLSGGGPPDAWLWDFGDGTTSVEAEPLHTYTAAGTYTVTMTVSNAFGSDTLAKTGLVVVDNIPPAAAFSATPTSGASPLVVAFTDESAGGVATSWTWYFGDGGAATTQHPVHTYTVPGTYAVTLTAANAFGSDTLTQSGYVVVGDGPPVLADFSGTPLTGTAPLTVSFTDLSIGNVIEWEWDFGDDVTSPEQNPVHVFTTPGEYDVQLQVHDAAGNDGETQKLKYVVVE